MNLQPILQTAKLVEHKGFLALQLPLHISSQHQLYPYFDADEKEPTRLYLCRIEKGNRITGAIQPRLKVPLATKNYFPVGTEFKIEVPTNDSCEFVLTKANNETRKNTRQK